MPTGTEEALDRDDPTDAPDAALRRLLPGERAPLERFVRSMRVPASEVDDVVQDALARAWRFRGGFEPTRPLGAWLRKIAVRAWSDRRRGLRTGCAPLPDDQPDDRTAPGPLRHDLDACLARLSPIERDVLLRFHRDGAALREIAEELAMPLNTVKSHLHRARRRLAEGEQP